MCARFCLKKHATVLYGETESTGGLDKRHTRLINQCFGISHHSDYLLERGETIGLAPFLVPQEKSVSINGFNLSVWWEKKNILFFRSALQIISSRPRFVLLAAAVRATRGRSSRYFRPRAARLAAASRWVVMFLGEIVIWRWEMNSSLSCHSTKINHDISVFESRAKGHLFHKRRLIVWL